MTASTLRAGLVLAAAFVLGAGCTPKFPYAPTTPQAVEGFEADLPPEPPGMPNDPPRALTLLPGDTVTLILTSAEVSREGGLTVDARGVLHLPLAGDVEVAGIPLADAEDRIEEALHRFDRTVRVTILLEDGQGHQATVIGAVASQGRYEVVPGMRVTDLIAAAGGPARSGSEEEGYSALFADLWRAQLIRDGEALPISVHRAVQGNPAHNVRVHPGDHLFVPPQLGSLVSVIGEVNGARVFPWFEGVRLSQALALAGGFTRDAHGGDIRIIRGPAEDPHVYSAGIDRVAEDTSHDPVLAPGDVVYVTSSALADFRDFMNTIAPVISIIAVGLTGVLAVAALSGGGI
ncbi:MAG: SLBB domain-containing protein [Sandaracinaceae bacterium]